jgi:hypothetical protein
MQYKIQKPKELGRFHYAESSAKHFLNGSKWSGTYLNLSNINYRFVLFASGWLGTVNGFRNEYAPDWEERESACYGVIKIRYDMSSLLMYIYGPCKLSRIDQ